jgi:hypothetical protein
VLKINKKIVKSSIKSGETESRIEWGTASLKGKGMEIEEGIVGNQDGLMRQWRKEQRIYLEGMKGK